jgi:hypothetical protein
VINVKRIYAFILMFLGVGCLVLWVSGGKISSSQQEEVLRNLGSPDAFEIFFFDQAKVQANRVEVWSYYGNEQTYEFSNRNVIEVTRIEEEPIDIESSPYSPLDFYESMSLGDVKTIASGEQFISGGDIVPRMFDGLELDIYYSKQLVVCFDRPSGAIVYVRSFALAPDREDAT